MVAIVTRAGKGSALTNTEMDANLDALNAGKSESGIQALHIPAGAMVARTTDGATFNTIEIGAGKVMLSSFDFVDNLAKYVQFRLKLPKQWNAGTFKFRAFWSHPSTTTNFGVAISMRAMAVGDAQAIDSAWGTAVVVTDTGGSTNTAYVTAESAPITASNVGADKEVIFEISRDVANGSDLMAVPLRLHGVELFITTDKVNDG